MIGLSDLATPDSIFALFYRRMAGDSTQIPSETTGARNEGNGFLSLKVGGGDGEAQGEPDTKVLRGWGAKVA